MRKNMVAVFSTHVCIKNMKPLEVILRSRRGKRENYREDEPKQG
jgi:hypothetical protein